MKIRTKLLFLTTCIIIALNISMAVFIDYNVKKDIVKSEQEVLLNYRIALADCHKELLRSGLDSYEITNQVEVIKKSFEIKTIKFQALKNIEFLKTINSDVNDSLNKIEILENFQTENIKSFFKVVENLIENSTPITTNFLDNEEYNDTIDISTNNSKTDTTLLLLYEKRMKEELSSLELGIDASLGIIDDQYDIIESKIRGFEAIGNRVSSILFIFILSISILASIIMSGKIVKSIKLIGSSLHLISTGDLTGEIKSTTKDEIGDVSKDMIQFQETLNKSLNTIQKHSIKSEDIKNELIATATETSAASVEIAANINSVTDQINFLNRNISDSNMKISTISTFTNELNNFISDQMAMVEESTASITEMIASIASVSNLTEKNRDVMSHLQDTAKDGNNQITETTDIIEDITLSVNKIGAMAEVIQNISDQTNLLAMNAAIEAAHAGDAGKGFAVVADEIRKLSEESAISSTDISKNLKDITNKFKFASKSSINTKEAFTKIYDSINNVSEALIAVSSSTSELNLGGKQILDAMDNLSQISSEVQHKSEEMKISANSVKDSTLQVSDISKNVTEAISEINIGFNEVKESVVGLESISVEIGQVSTELNIECQKFITK